MDFVEMFTLDNFSVLKSILKLKLSNNRTNNIPAIFDAKINAKLMDIFTFTATSLSK